MSKQLLQYPCKPNEITAHFVAIARRSAIATAMTAWWANESPQNATRRAAVANFGAVDDFAFTIVQSTDVSVINATFIANISEGTSGAFTYVSQVWIGIQANTSAFATNVNALAGSSRRHLSQLDRSPSAAAQLGILALETKVLALGSSFYGASSCNTTEVSLAYYDGGSPVLSGDRQFRCVNYPVGRSNNIDTYLTSNSAVWASLPLFHILVMNSGPTVVRQSPSVDVDSVILANIRHWTQEDAARQARWQLQLGCLNATIANSRHLHELTALVEASLATEGQIAQSAALATLVEQLLAMDTLSDADKQLFLDLQLGEASVLVGC